MPRHEVCLLLLVIDCVTQGFSLWMPTERETNDINDETRAQTPAISDPLRVVDSDVKLGSVPRK
jgi:hypothetical protein